MSMESETYDPLLTDSDDDSDNYPTFEDLYNDLKSVSIDYDESLYTKEDAIFLKLSAYDATPLPINSYLAGGSLILPLPLTKRNRPFLKNLSVIALLYHQERWHTSFEFRDLVKCTYWSDFRTPRLRSLGGEREPTEYYITFEAKAKGDPSNSPDAITTTFQTKVLVYDEVKDKSPVVEECRIKTMAVERKRTDERKKTRQRRKKKTRQRRKKK